MERYLYVWNGHHVLGRNPGCFFFYISEGSLLKVEEWRDMFGTVTMFWVLGLVGLANGIGMNGYMYDKFSAILHPAWHPFPRNSHAVTLREVAIRYSGRQNQNQIGGQHGEIDLGDSPVSRDLALCFLNSAIAYRPTELLN